MLELSETVIEVQVVRFELFNETEKLWYISEIDMKTIVE